MKHVQLYTLLILLILTSCVGNKKVAYLQHQDEEKAHRKFIDSEATNPVQVYRLEAGDVLFISIEKFRLGEEFFSISNFEEQTGSNTTNHPYLAGHRVDSAGFITVPLIGEVMAAGRTVAELKDDIQSSANEQYPGSVVEVFQLDGTVSVLGEVNNPGQYPLYKEQNTIFDVLAFAGDIKSFGDRAHVKVIRQQGNSTRIFHMNLNDVNALNSDGYYIRNSDIVIITPLERRKYSTANIQWLVSGVTALVAVASLVVSISR